MILHRIVALATAIAGCALTAGAIVTAVAQAPAYPDRTVKIVIPAAPGGPTDVPARLASQILQPRLGQPVVVENRAGAAGALAARAVATAAPDGYTLLMGNTSTLAVIPAVSSSAGYDPVKDFTPIARIFEGFQILVVHPSAPWKSVKELIDDSKTNPGKINYAHTGPGGLPHLAGELFFLRSGAKMTGVPYRSGGESVTAVLSQAVHATFESIAILGPLIREGKVRALGAQNATRSSLLPDLPTMAELGIPNAEANTFYGLVAPAGTSAAIVKTLNAALNEGLQTPEIQSLIAGIGGESKANSSAEFAAYVAEQHRKWQDVGKAANVHIN